MALCCEKQTTAPPRRLTLPCPSCNVVGRTVHNATVRALAREHRADLAGNDDFNLCMTKDCSVAYYAGDGRTLALGDMRITFAHKSDEADRLLCYCHSLRASAVAREIATNPAARTFGAIAEIFQLNNCDCANHHPLGGSCACATDIGRQVKSEMAKLEPSAASTGTVPLWLYDKSHGCCGPARTGELADFLRRRCGWADVREFDLADDSAQPPAPPEFIQLLVTQGDAALPILLLDGKVVSSGRVPNFLEVMTSINTLRRQEDANG